MKKLVKVLVVFMAFFSQLPLVGAQESSLTYAELMEKAQEAVQKVESLHVDSTATVNVMDKDNRPNNLTANLEADLDLKNMNFQGEASLNATPATNVNLEVVLNGVQLFLRQNDGEWQVSNVEASKQRLQEAFTQAMSQTSNTSELNQELVAAFAELVDVEESDDEYTVSLKNDIDGAKFYQDHEALFNKLKDLSLEQARQTGQTVDPEALDTVYSAESFKKFFQLNPTMVAKYDKETFLPKEVTLTAKAKVADFVNQDTGLDTIDVMVTVSFDKYNEPVQIENPVMEDQPEATSSDE